MQNTPEPYAHACTVCKLFPVTNPRACRNAAAIRGYDNYMARITASGYQLGADNCASRLKRDVA